MNFVKDGGFGFGGGGVGQEFGGGGGGYLGGVVSSYGGGGGSYVNEDYLVDYYLKEFFIIVDVKDGFV